MAYPQYHTQKHHLIPTSVFTGNDYPTLKHNAKLAGYDINHKKNGMCLPSFIVDIIQHDLQCHRGNHPPSYYEEIKKLLRKLEGKVTTFCKGKNNHNSISRELISRLNRISHRAEMEIRNWNWLLRTHALSERESSRQRLFALNSSPTT